MERVIERLELDRDLLGGEIDCLESELRELKDEMKERREDLRELKNDRSDMARASHTLHSLAQKIPGLWPAKNPVCQALLELHEEMNAIEDDLKRLLGLYQEKKMIYVDKKLDLESILLYLNYGRFSRGTENEYAMEMERIIS